MQTRTTPWLSSSWCFRQGVGTSCQNAGLTWWSIHLSLLLLLSWIGDWLRSVFSPVVVVPCYSIYCCLCDCWSNLNHHQMLPFVPPLKKHPEYRTNTCSKKKWPTLHLSKTPSYWQSTQTCMIFSTNKRPRKHIIISDCVCNLEREKQVAWLAEVTEANFNNAHNALH